MTEERAREDLAVIRRIMEESRREVTDRGVHFLIWGGISTVGLVLTWLALEGPLGLNPAWAWVGLLAVGWAASVILGRRAERGARVATLGRRLLSVTWVATGITMTAVGLAGMFADPVPPWILPGVLSLLIAPPVLVTARLTGEAWLGGVAAGWWLGGGLMLLVPGTYTLLLMAGMTLALLALPGAVLFARTRGSGTPAGPVDATA